MKQVLAELHSLINDLEDQGLTAEASSLQDVFIRVAEEAETDDLANDVKAILESHPVAKVLEEIAKQMGGDVAGAGDEDAQTSSFANELPDSGAGEASGEDEARRAVIEKWSKRFRDKIDYFIDENQKNANINWNRSEATRELRENFPNAPEITYEEIAGDDATGLIQRAIEPSVREQHEDMNRRHPKGFDARGYGSWWE